MIGNVTVKVVPRSNADTIADARAMVQHILKSGTYQAGSLDAELIDELADRLEAAENEEKDGTVKIVAAMARRRREDGGPVLFSELTDCGPTAHWPDERPGPYGKPVDAAGDSRHRDAIERALAQLRAALEGEELSRCATARAILEGALDG